MFKAIQITRDDDGNTDAAVTELDESDLPDGEVLVAVEYSTLNYKDGLCLNGQGGLVRDYPHVPGIDFSGSVLSSSDDRFQKGDKVVLTGWHVGERHWGGYSQRARVRADWLVKLPEGLDSRSAMIVGTAGLTATLGLLELENAGITPDSGPVLVTGASGGVGSVACALLARGGYEIEAATGRPDESNYLEALGATRIVERSSIDTPNGKPLNAEHWAACIDSVGGAMLANVLTRLRHSGAVAAIGLAGGNSLETTVIPFLLRGISLRGIDSVTCPLARREEAWQRIVADLPLDVLESMTETVSLDEVIDRGKAILEGKVRGRLVVDVNA